MKRSDSQLVETVSCMTACAAAEQILEPAMISAYAALVPWSCLMRESCNLVNGTFPANKLAVLKHLCPGAGFNTLICSDPLMELLHQALLKIS